MLKLPIYIYETGYTVYSDLDATIAQGYAPMYQKELVLYKGVTNTIKFTVKNQDQKPLNINGSVFRFNMINKDTGATYLNKELLVLDDGSTRATRGVVQLTLNESDLISLTSQFYRFSIIQTVNGIDKPTYSNTYHDAEGLIEIKDAVYPPFSLSNEYKDFSRYTTNFLLQGTPVVEYRSSVYNAQPEFKRANSTHTVAYSGTAYNGEIQIQATLDTQPSQSTDWVNVKSINLSNFTGIDYANVSGVYSFMRFVHIPTISNTGTLDKIVIRS
jgi:hypothetical protein